MSRLPRDSRTGSSRELAFRQRRAYRQVFLDRYGRRAGSWWPPKAEGGSDDSAHRRRPNVEGNRPADEMRAEDQSMCRRVRLTARLGLSADAGEKHLTQAIRIERTG